MIYSCAAEVVKHTLPFPLFCSLDLCCCEDEECVLPFEMTLCCCLFWPKKRMFLMVYNKTFLVVFLIVITRNNNLKNAGSVMCLKCTFGNISCLFSILGKVALSSTPKKVDIHTHTDRLKISGGSGQRPVEHQSLHNELNNTSTFSLSKWKVNVLPLIGSNE